MNLDKLLKKIEKNKENSEKTEIQEYTIGGETYEVRTFTRSEKRELIYSFQSNKNMTAGDIAKVMIKPIYKCFNLSQLAVKAKDAGYIKSYYDVVEMLFEPEEIVEIAGHLLEINGITENDVTGEVNEIKK